MKPEAKIFLCVHLLCVHLPIAVVLLIGAGLHAAPAKPTYPILSSSGLTALTDATGIDGLRYVTYRTAPNVRQPTFTTPAGWQTFSDLAYSDASARWIVTLRTPRTEPPAPAPTPAPNSPNSQPPTTPLPTVPTPAVPAPAVPTPAVPTAAAKPGASYTVAASEVLFVTSITGTPIQPRTWEFLGQTKTGYNCGFAVPATTAAGQYTLTETAAGAASSVPVTHAVTVTADPYRTVTLPAGADLAAAIAAAPDRTRFVLSGDYTIARQPYVAQRLQLVGNPSARILLTPAIPAGAKTWPGFFGTWNTTPAAKVSVANIHFLGVTGGKLDSDGKTGIAGAYCVMGSYHAYNVQWGNLDVGIQGDSTQQYAPDGVLVEGCQCNDGTLYGCGLWIGGRDWDIDNCLLGPSKLEHPLRSSIVDTRNQVPQFVRVAHCTLTAVNPTPAGKEAFAPRDIRYLYADDNAANQSVFAGQGTVNPWDVCEFLTFNNMRISRDTIHLRMGVTGPATITHSTFQVAPVIGVKAGVAVTMAGNKP